MPDLKLARLPDRVPVKITFSATPELNRELTIYADLYKESYGEVENVSALVPFMLQAFLDGDRAFQKAMKDRFSEEGTVEEGGRRSQRPVAES